MAFVDDLNAFIKATGCSPSLLGKLAIGDSAFVLRVRNGRSPREVTMNIVRDWMAENADRRDWNAVVRIIPQRKAPPMVSRR